MSLRPPLTLSPLCHCLRQRPCIPPPPFVPPPIPLPRRTFFNNPTQTLTATRQLPYLSAPLFRLIADVDSYSDFIPFCKHSHVTHWSSPSSYSSASTTAGSTTNDIEAGVEAGTRLPTQATLHIGFEIFAETFTSRLNCNPSLGIVEALSGPDIQLLPPPTHSSTSPTTSPTTPQPSSRSRPPPLLPQGGGGVFTSMTTRWTVRQLRPPLPSTSSSPLGLPQAPRTTRQAQVQPGQPQLGPLSRVDLHISFQFTNPLYSAVSNAVSEKMATIMIQAFEARARAKLGVGGS